MNKDNITQIYNFCLDMSKNMLHKDTRKEDLFSIGYDCGASYAYERIAEMLKYMGGVADE